MKFDLVKPCQNCPFRIDRPLNKGWLGKIRATEIAQAITIYKQTFQCHKTLDKPNKDAQHCGGATILLEHLERPNQMMRIAERCGYYDRTKVRMDSPVFKTPEEFIEFHSE